MGSDIGKVTIFVLVFRCILSTCKVLMAVQVWLLLEIRAWLLRSPLRLTFMLGTNMLLLTVIKYWNDHLLVIMLDQASLLHGILELMGVGQLMVQVSILLAQMV